MQEQAFAQAFKPTIWHRLDFGHAHVAPWHDDDDGDANYLVANTAVMFDWRDRLRVLLTGRVHVHVRTRTEVPAGRVESRAAVKVMGWGWTI